MSGITAVTRTLHKEVRYDEARETTAMLTLQAPKLLEDHEKARGGVDIVVVLDKSGSMSGPKLQLCKETCNLIVRELGARDRMGLVAFDTGVNTPLPMVRLDNTGKSFASLAIDTLRAGSSTNLSGGLFAGISLLEECIESDPAPMEVDESPPQPSPGSAAQASSPLSAGSGPHFGAAAVPTATAVPLAQETAAPEDAHAEKGVPAAEAVSSGAAKERLRMILLLTDGQANVGVRDTDTLVAMTQDALGHLPPNVKLFTFGYGNVHNDELLSSLASSTAGRYAHVEFVDDVQGAFADCLGGAMSLVAQNISVKIRPQGGAEIVGKPLTKLSCSPDGAGFEVKIPDLYAEEKRNILVRVRLPKLTAPVPLADDAPVAGFEFSYANCLTAKIAKDGAVVGVARPDGETSTELDPDIRVQKLRFDSAQVIAETQDWARRGDLERARQGLRAQIARVNESRSVSDEAFLPLHQCLQTDLEDCLSGVRSRDEFGTRGHKVLSIHGAEYAYERAAKSSARNTSMYRTGHQAAVRQKWAASTSSVPEEAGASHAQQPRRPSPGQNSSTARNRSRLHEWKRPQARHQQQQQQARAGDGTSAVPNAAPVQQSEYRPPHPSFTRQNSSQSGPAAFIQRFWSRASSSGEQQQQQEQEQPPKTESKKDDQAKDGQ